jgi:hypothetical protein
MRTTLPYLLKTQLDQERGDFAWLQNGNRTQSLGDLDGLETYEL